MSCAGDKIYLRAGTQVNGFFRPQIYGFTLDPVTGALGDTPFLTIDNVAPPWPTSFFGNQLAISRDGTLLIVNEPTGFPTSPPTPRVSYFNTTTGARLDYFTEYQGETPRLVSTVPCCVGTGLRLGIQRLTSGLIQITATGKTGQKYELQKSQNLVVWDKLLEFQMIASPTPYTDPDSQTISTRFYRLKLLP